MIFQLTAEGLDERFPPLRSLDSPEMPSNLPVQLTSFVGRDAEVRDIADALREHRLVMITGAGGVGKTRLALQVAAELVGSWSHGVWFVDLNALTDPGRVVPTAMTTLGLREIPGRGPRQSLVEALIDRELLIVFDNCEHLIEECARIADVLLRSCPKLRILATSREPLGINGEQIHRVASLTFPEPSDNMAAVRNTEAVRLLVERAREHHPQFAVTDQNATVASLCRRLDGIPLAIELAAARLRTMGLDDIEHRLDQRFRLLTGGSRAALARQRTLEATVAWSFDLLKSSEQAVLARLGVCAGTFDLAAAEAIAAGPVERWEVPDLLGSLVDKSLVQIDESELGVRYHLLETIRHFAVGQLAAAGGQVVRDVRWAHARYYRQVAEANEWAGLGPDFERWAARLDADRDNFLVALEVFLGDERGGWEACRLVAALRWYWLYTDTQSEMAELVRRLLQRPDVVDTTIERARLLLTAAQIEEHGVLPSARPLLEEAIAEAKGEASVVAEACSTLMWNRHHAGDDEAVMELGHRAVDAARKSTNPQVLISALNSRGLGERDPEGARAEFAEALVLCESNGDLFWSAIITINLGCLEMIHNNFDEARAAFERALAAPPIGRSRWIRANFSRSLGAALVALGDLPGAARRFADCLTLSDQCHADSELVYGVLGAALVAGASGRFEEAATLLGAADRRFEVIGAEPENVEARMQKAASASVREQLGPDFRTAFEAGRQMNRSDALSRALATVTAVAGESTEP